LSKQTNKKIKVLLTLQLQFFQCVWVGLQYILGTWNDRVRAGDKK